MAGRFSVSSSSDSVETFKNVVNCLTLAPMWVKYYFPPRSRLYSTVIDVVHLQLVDRHMTTIPH